MKFRVGSFLLFLAVLSNLNSYSQLNNSKLIPGFTLSTGDMMSCGTIVSFIDTSKIIYPCNVVGDSCDSIVDWKWSFGDSYSSKLKNPTNNYNHVISESPYYNVYLKLRTKYGLRDSILKTIFVAETEGRFIVKKDTIIEVGDSVVFETQGNIRGNNSQWEWYFGDGKIIKNPDNRNVGHRYKVLGKYEVYLMVKETNTYYSKNIWCTDLYPDTTINEKKIIITVKEPGGILNHSFTKPSIFPNPAKDYILLKGVENGEVYISDLFGKEVLKKELRSNESIDISPLTQGIYFVKFSSGGNNYTRRFIKN